MHHRTQCDLYQNINNNNNNKSKTNTRKAMNKHPENTNAEFFFPSSLIAYFWNSTSPPCFCPKTFAAEVLSEESGEESC